MADMSLKKHEMPVQDPYERGKNFREVALGYDEETAVKEAERCLGCKNSPCVSGCPVNINIPEFIKRVAERRFDEAYDEIAKASSLPAICGRVCPQENQCEGKCIRAIKGESVGIGRLERFVADRRMQKGEKAEAAPKKNGKRVCVVGSGPSGLACASALAKEGFDVTVYEALHTPGGVLVYGIPEFRLPKAIVRHEIDALSDLGVKIETNVVVGKTVTLDEIRAEYDAVFIGSGAGLPRFMNIKGESLKGVYSANEFLTRVNLMKAYLDNSDTPVKKGKRVCVVGGGNVAMDAARSALRLGAEEVYIVYRRSMAELPARAEEVHHAEEEGIIFKLLTNPTEIMGDENGFVSGIKCVEMELGEPDASGRRRPVVKENSEFTIECDVVIMAIGTSPNPLLKESEPDLETEKWGGIKTFNEAGQTSLENVYAGGDAVTGAATVILAMGAGKAAAFDIAEKLK